MKRQKEHTKMVRALSVGDEAVSNGGFLGRITEVNEHFVRLEIAKGVEVNLQKNAVSQVMPKGTYKATP